MKSQFQKLFQHFVLYVNRQHRLRALTLGLLNRFPGLKTRLARAFFEARISTGAADISGAKPPRLPTETADLTAQARRIYADISAASKRQPKIDR